MSSLFEKLFGRPRKRKAGSAHEQEIMDLVDSRINENLKTNYNLIVLCKIIAKTGITYTIAVPPENSVHTLGVPATETDTYTANEIAPLCYVDGDPHDPQILPRDFLPIALGAYRYQQMKWYKLRRNAGRSSALLPTEGEPDYLRANMTSHNIPNPPGNCTMIGATYGYTRVNNTIYELDVQSTEATIPIVRTQTLAGLTITGDLGLNTNYLYFKETYAGYNVILCVRISDLTVVRRFYFTDTRSIYFTTVAPDGETVAFLYKAPVSIGSYQWQLRLKILAADLDIEMFDGDPGLYRLVENEQDVYYLYQRKQYGPYGFQLSGTDICFDSNSALPEAVYSPAKVDVYIGTGDPEWPLDHCVQTHNNRLSGEPTAYDVSRDILGAISSPDLTQFGNHPRLTLSESGNFVDEGAYHVNNYLTDNTKIVIGADGGGTTKLRCFNKNTGEALWEYSTNLGVMSTGLHEDLYITRTVDRKTGQSYYTAHEEVAARLDYKCFGTIRTVQLLALTSSYVLCQEIEVNTTQWSFLGPWQSGYDMILPYNAYCPYVAQQWQEYQRSSVYAAPRRQNLLLLNAATGAEVCRFSLPDDDYLQYSRRATYNGQTFDYNETYYPGLKLYTDSLSDSGKFALTNDFVVMAKLFVADLTGSPGNLGSFGRVSSYTWSLLDTHNFADTHKFDSFAYSITEQVLLFYTRFTNIQEYYMYLRIINNILYIHCPYTDKTRKFQLSGDTPGTLIEEDTSMEFYYNTPFGNGVLIEGAWLYHYSS